MMKYVEPEMEVICFEFDPLTVTHISGNDGPGDNGGDSYDDWVNMSI